jgi:hypothetical protein
LGNGFLDFAVGSDVSNLQGGFRLAPGAGKEVKASG